MYHDRTKSLWLGIGLIIAGFFITLWQSIYSIGAGVEGIPILAFFLVPTILIGIGFGIIAYYFWKQFKEYSKSFKSKKGFEP